MTFRKLSKVLQDVLADLRIDEAGCGCSDERAPTPAHPDTRGTELREAGCPEGGNEHPAYARQIGGGGRPSAMRKTGKEPGTREPPAKYEESVAVKEPTPANRRVLRLISSKDLPRRAPTKPHRGLGNSLVLVVDNGHHAAYARRAAI